MRWSRVRMSSARRRTAVILSILLAADVAVWIASGWWRLSIAPTASIRFHLTDGAILVVWYVEGVPFEQLSSEEMNGLVLARHARRWDYSWVPIWLADRRQIIVGVPLWYTAAIVAIVFSVLVLTRRRLCTTCSNCMYNLTGNMSGRCPECGTPFAHSAG
jgi:hypothetical protein